MKHMILSHYDLDGIVSVINIYNTITNKDNFQYSLVGYTSLSKELNKLKKENFDVLWILDLNLKQEHIPILREIQNSTNCQKMIWIDHHTYEYDVREELDKYGVNCSFEFSKDICASLATNQFVSIFKPQISEISYSLSKVTDVYDMWRRNDSLWKESYALNDLFWEYGFEKFFKKFRNGYILDTEDIETIEKINIMRDDYVKETINKYMIWNEDCKAVYIFNPACKHTNHFQLVLYDVKYYVVLKEYSKEHIGYSVRLYDNDLNLTIQSLFGRIKEMGIKVLTSGGHEKVGSITVSYEDNEKFLDCINCIFEERNKND